ncbi:MAG: hypothetical protein ACLSB9_23840 [Hydrogeniiclostridium mannosilyticum]
MVSVIHRGLQSGSWEAARSVGYEASQIRYTRTAGDVQRLQRGLLPYRRKRRLIAGAKVAEFYRPMLYLSCHPLQFLRQLFRGACILVRSAAIRPLDL